MTRSRRNSTDNSSVTADPVNSADESRASGPAESDIARRAFERYCERGCEDGHHVEDWLEAERELRGGRPNTESGTEP